MIEPIRVFFDGSCNDKYKTAAFIVKQHDEVLNKYSVNIDVPSSVYAEYKALELGLDWANSSINGKNREIIFHGDCKPVVMNVIKFKYLERSDEFAQLVDAHARCRNLYDLLKKKHKVDIQWIPRSQNTEVDDFSRPETQRKGWRYGIVREINDMIISYSKHNSVRDIQRTVNDFLRFYTGKCTYTDMSEEQLIYLHKHMKGLICATIM